MHNPREYLKIAQDRAALQELYPLSISTVPPEAGHMIMQYKIAQYYLRNFQNQGLSNPCTSRKYKDYKPELMYRRCTSTAEKYSNTWILRYPRKEIMT